MNSIPNIAITQEEIKRKIFYQKVGSGAEAVICESDRTDTVYKIFVQNGKIIEMSDNKFKKILKIYNMNLEHSVHPISTISLDDKIIGYEMSCDWDYSTCTFYELSLKEKVEFLKRSKKILEYFSQKEIVYGDLSMRNILINRHTGDIIFCDMDNIQIEELPIDIYSSELEYYTKERKIDTQTHAYMHNLMSLQAFDLDMFWSSKREILKNFKTPAFQIISSMKYPENFNGDYVIRHIRTR